MVVGLGDYVGSGLRDLDGAEREAAEVVKAFDAAATDTYLGQRASRQAVLAALPTASHVHVAAHGTFDADQPAESGIILRDGTTDGHATVSLAELRRLDLRKVRVITLATCRSAQAAALPGRERISLPSALLDAGAGGVIASLWPVQDAPSVELMTELYRRMRTLRPAAALAKLQAEAAKQRRDPDTWAGLVFYGND
jgi:CHAT domain-containing protein